jgi:2-polyprenyl-6-methoxyphenol hydroxylase-like FAD-dependent oxidoreductase
MKMLIVGGGIAGSALASYLQNKNLWEITLIEKAEKWRNIGFNISIWASGIEVIDRLGLLKEFKEKALAGDSGKFYDYSGSLIANPNFPKVQNYGSYSCIHRADLHEILTHSLKNVEISFNTTILEIENSKDGIYVQTSDKKTETFDIVVAADGMRSQTRSFLAPPEVLESYDWYMIGLWLPKNLPRPDSIVQILGKEFMAFLIPTSGDCTIGIIKKVDSSFSEPDKIFHKWLKDFTADMAPFIEKVIATLNNTENIYKDKLQYVDMNNWTNGRAIFIGDARHGVSPIAGIGASLALEDAFVLGEELGKIEGPDFMEGAFDKFTKRRERKLRHARKFIDATETNFMRVKSPLGLILRNKIVKFYPELVLNHLKAYLQEPL